MTKSLTDRQYKYYLDEYKARYSEIEHCLKAQRQIEIWIITAVLVIYGWIFSGNPQGIVKHLALLTPPILTILGFITEIFYIQQIYDNGIYIRERIEKQILGPEGGWECDLEKNEKEKQGIFKYFGYLKIASIGIVAIATAALCVYLW